jgi:hypothetical protein
MQRALGSAAALGARRFVKSQGEGRTWAGADNLREQVALGRDAPVIYEICTSRFTTLAYPSSGSASAVTVGALETHMIRPAVALLALAALVATPPLSSAQESSAQKTSAQKKVSKPSAAKVTHKLAIQVAENNPQLMNLALNNAKNVVDYYKGKGEDVAIEIVTFGPGLHMLRDDTSPVKQRVAAMALETPNIAFIACANTQANMSKQENKSVTLISEAKVMPSGVVRLMELQGKGYSYIRP